MKEIKVEVPKGYEIDRENSTFECIKLKEKEVKIKTWDDICENGVKIKGFVVDSENSIIYSIDPQAANKHIKCIYSTEKEAISARAAAMISQLMPYYGGAIDESSWRDIMVDKFVIRRVGGIIDFEMTAARYHFLAFHTKEQRDDFYDNNEQLVKDYFMLD